MAVTFAVGLKACCVAVGLLMVTAAHAAEPISPLVGVTRDQLLSRYGEPKSQIETGNRVVFFYPREKIVLRDNIVVEVEQIAGEAAPSTPSEPPAAGVSPAAPAGPATGSSESRLEIKLVRPPGFKDTRPAAAEAPKTPVTVTPPRPSPAVPQNRPVVEQTAPKAPSETIKPVEEVSRSEIKAEPAKSDEAPPKKTAEDLARAKKAEPVVTTPAPAAPPPSPASVESPIGSPTYLIVLAVVLGGAGLLFWKYRQRQIELAASSVENTPLTTPTTPVFTGSGFSADILAKLEWRRFEELVAAYYSKTGVVAVRTKTGPKSPVHIKISWKGEPRPFAYVQCIAQPGGLIDPKPLQALVAALAADDIRRGYVVTPGKFNVVARDLAEEKHLTLLSGDVFLEKLNALPPGARAEIMQSVSAGDYAVPSCPKCETKMVQSADDPPVWRCPNHPDETLPVRT